MYLSSIYKLIGRFADVECCICSSFGNLVRVIFSWILNNSTILYIPLLKRPNTIVAFYDIVRHMDGKLRTDLIPKYKEIVLLKVVWNIFFLVRIYDRIRIENCCIDKRGIIEEKLIYLLLRCTRNEWICLIFTWGNIEAIISP